MKRRERGVLLVTGLCSAALGVALALAGVASRADLRFLDALESHLLPRVPSRVVVVKVDTDALDVFNWPISRDLYGGAIQALASAGARGIGMDLLFHSPSPVCSGEEADPDTVLAVAANDHRAVLGTAISPNALESPRRATAAAPVCSGTDPTTAAYPALPGTDIPVAIGHVHVDPDPDGVYRSITPCRPTRDGCVADLGATMAGVALDDATCRGRELVPFLRRFDQLPQAGLTKVIRGDPETLALVKDRYVIFGETDARTGDYGATPRAAYEPLVTVHANRIDALLAGIRIRPVAAPVALAAALLALAPLLLLGARARDFLLGAAGGALLAVAASAAAFAGGLRWLPPSLVALPMVAGAAVPGAWLGVRYLRFNEMLGHAFGAYVAPEVLDWLRETGGAALDPGSAQTRWVTILFSDVAGYTRLSNTLSAPQIMESLRLYIGEMVAIARRHGGYIDKINGDGLMILFGAPREDADHARHAIACAREMQRRVAELAPRWRALTGTDLAIRIGVATGPAFVGNLGGEGHIEYTAIGRPVNLAARLEGKSELGGVLVSAETWQALGQPPGGDRREVELKGYETTGPIAVWQIKPGGKA